MREHAAARGKVDDEGIGAELARVAGAALTLRV